MDSKPEEAQITSEQKNKLQDMDFDIDDQLLKVQKSNSELDHELLQIQRRKSTPKVVIEEFVQVDSDDDKSEEKPENKSDGNLWCDHMNCEVNKKPHKIMKHIEIEDVSYTPSTLLFGALSFVGAIGKLIVGTIRWMQDTEFWDLMMYLYLLFLLMQFTQLTEGQEI